MNMINNIFYEYMNKKKNISRSVQKNMSMLLQELQ